MRISDIKYDPDTGVFTYVGGNKKVSAGARAGTVNVNGYRVITIDKKKYYEHRLAFLFMTMEIPPREKLVDHINGIRDDNRWINLRLATASMNAHNRFKLSAKNSSGVDGITFYKGKWQASIRVNRKNVYIGRFTSKHAAIAARKILKTRAIGAANDNNP